MGGGRRDARPGKGLEGFPPPKKCDGWTSLTPASRLFVVASRGERGAAAPHGDRLSVGRSHAVGPRHKGAPSDGHRGRSVLAEHRTLEAPA